MKIMYVEDNAVNLSLIERIAQMNKHELISFDEAELALQEIEQGEGIDLILLDIQLAGEMDGIAFAHALRERGYKQPVIAITAYAMMGDKERIIAAGCNDYLPKPLPISEFLALLAKYDPSVYKPDAAPSVGQAAAATTQPKAETPTPEVKSDASSIGTKSEAATAQPETVMSAQESKLGDTPVDTKAEATSAQPKVEIPSLESDKDTETSAKDSSPPDASNNRQSVTPEAAAPQESASSTSTPN